MRTLENSQFSQKRRETLGLLGVPWLYGSLSNTTPTYTVIPPTSGLNYKINIYDIFVAVEGHYHEHQTQDILVLEGRLKVQLDDNDPIILGPLGKVQILPKVWHALEPIDGPVRYVSTYFFDAAQHPTGLPFPEDVNFTKKIR